MEILLAICALALFAILLYTYRSNRLERKRINRLEKSLIPVRSQKNITARKKIK